MDAGGRRVLFLKGGKPSAFGVVGILVIVHRSGGQTGFKTVNLESVLVVGTREFVLEYDNKCAVCELVDDVVCDFGTIVKYDDGYILVESVSISSG
ncbi:MAG: hypothetical protein J6C81_06385 [Muribaculaceae bacterium]|nr:hypothetical protein [Muribaculaceae bacterium]